MPDPIPVKGGLDDLRFTLDPTGDTPTYVEIPVDDVLGTQEGTSKFTETSQGPVDVNGRTMQAAAAGTGAYVLVRYSPEAPYIATLKAASSGNKRIWFEETPVNSLPVLIGGRRGAKVRVASKPTGDFGNFAFNRIEYDATDTEAGGTFEEIDD